jgi:hypothetical protein
VQPVEISLDQERSVTENVGWPLETAFLQPLLHDRDSQRGTCGVLRNEAIEAAQEACVILRRGWMAKVLCLQEPLNELPVEE